MQPPLRAQQRLFNVERHAHARRHAQLAAHGGRGRRGAGARRRERRPDSKYAAIENCRYEVAAAEKLMRQAGIPYLDSTTKSIEEIATHMLHEAHLVRRVY